MTGQLPTFADIVIVGGGIVGASIAYALAPHRRVVLIEREDAFGYHSTGRSAALFLPSYGPPSVRALTAASRAFLTNPPEGFGGSILHPRGILVIATPDQAEQFEEHLARSKACGSPVKRLTPEQAAELVPLLRPELFAQAYIDHAALDIDVDRLHQGYLSAARRRGAVTLCATLQGAARAGERWAVRTSEGDISAAVIVNASGAWADEVAQACGVEPLGHVPCRRTAVIIPAGDHDPSGWPLVEDTVETYYFKPEGGNLMVSPADATPDVPGDTQAEELDVAIAIDRFEQAMGVAVKRPLHRWAGLRTFSPDGEPVLGRDAREAQFMWATGLGGYGVQTAPAVGRLVSALIQGSEPTDFGVPMDSFAPKRFAR